jgi:hypothetical protein
LTLLTTQNISRTGVTPAYTAVTASDTFLPGRADLHPRQERRRLPGHVRRRGCSPATRPAWSSATSVSVTNAQERMIGPFPSQFFADPTTGLATVTHSFTTTVTSGIFNLTQP